MKVALMNKGMKMIAMRICVEKGIVRIGRYTVINDLAPIPKADVQAFGQVIVSSCLDQWRVQFFV